MRGGQRGRRLAPDADRLGDGKPAFRLEAVGEALSLDVRHREVGESVRFADTIDGDDVRMLQAGRELGFALEARPEAGAHAELGVEHLDGDEALERPLPREVDRGHSSLAEEADDLVFSAEGGAHAIESGLGGKGHDRKLDEGTVAA